MLVITDAEARHRQWQRIRHPDGQAPRPLERLEDAQKAGGNAAPHRKKAARQAERPKIETFGFDALPAISVKPRNHGKIR